VSLDPAVTQKVTAGLEQAYEDGRLQGQNEERARYFGKSARVLTGNLFAASLEAASQMLGQYDPEAAAFFNEKSNEIRAWATPPQVRSVEPADAATAIAPGNPVSARFVAAIDPETLTDDSFYVYPASGGSHLAGEVTYDERSHTATFTPSKPLSANTEYMAVLDASVASIGGSGLGDPYQWSFRTGAA
jgi:hypothetical protein